MIIVKETSTLKKFALIGTGYTEYESATPGVLLGNLSPNINHGTAKKLCLSDKNGRIHWADADNYKVFSIDGIEVHSVDIDEVESSHSLDNNSSDDVDYIIDPKYGVIKTVKK